MKFEYWKSSDGHWYWHFKAGNSEVICSGEGYSRKEDCLHAIDLVKCSNNAALVAL